MKRDQEFYLILLSFIVIYLVWGSTYLANQWALDSFPPFLLASSRTIISGLIMLLSLRFFGKLECTWLQAKNALIGGVLFFSIGNGLVVWGLQFVESGMTALIIAMQPLIIALMLWFINGEKPKLMGWVGLGVGMLGMLLLIGQPELMGNTKWVYGLMAIVVAVLAWSYGSIWIGTADMPKSIFLNAALQMLFGGVVLVFMSLAMSEYPHFDFSAITHRSWLSMLFLISFGSIMAFTAFNYLLIKVSPVKVSTSTYINPIIAVFLGWWLNGEGLTPKSIIASALLLLGVFLINAGKMRRVRASKA